MVKRVVIACGTGMATSTMMAEKVRNLLEKNNIDYSLSQCQLSELDSYKKNADLFITAMKITTDYGVPIVVGTPFLTDIGEQAVEEKILSILKE